MPQRNTDRGQDKVAQQRHDILLRGITQSEREGHELFLLSGVAGKRPPRIPAGRIGRAVTRVKGGKRKSGRQSLV